MLLLLLVGIVTSATYNSTVQTVFVKQFIKSLGKNLHTKISVKNVNVSLFNDLIINNLYIEDLHHDTLAYIQNITVNINDFSYNNKVIALDKVTLKSPYFNLKKYKGDSANNLNFLITYFSPKDTSKTEWKFKLNAINIIDGRFNYNDFNIENKKIGVDYNHISINDFNTQLTKIRFIDNGVNCKIKHLQLSEKSGFRLNNLISNFSISPQGISNDKLTIKTPFSDIKGSIIFLTKTYGNLADFIDKVNITSHFDSSLVSFKDIDFFAPTLVGLNKSLILSGNVKGKINNLKARNLKIVVDDGTIFKGNADISGIPNLDNLFLYINIKELITNRKRLNKLPIYPFNKNKFLKLPPNFNHLGNIKFKGKVTGFINDLVAYGSFKTRIGTVTTDISLNTNNTIPIYKGKIQTKDFDLGKFIEIPKKVGKITMNVDVDGKGFSKKELQANLTGKINKIEINNYEYNNVEVKGLFENQIFNGFLAVADQNITFDFNGKVDLSGKLPHFNFESNIKKAKLEELNMIKNNLSTNFSGRLKVDMLGNHLDNMLGKVALNNAYYTDKNDSIYIGNTLITSTKNKNNKKLLEIKSDVLDAQVEGEYHFDGLIEMVNNLTLKYIPSFKNDMPKTDKIKLTNNFKFNFDFHQMEILSKLFLGGLKLSEHTNISGTYNSENQSLSIKGNVPKLSYASININNINIISKPVKDTFLLNITADKIYESDSLFINNFSVLAKICKDTLLTIVGWKNNGITKNEAQLSVITSFDGYNKNKSKILKAYAYLSDTLWRVGENNFIINDSIGLTISGLSFKSKTQSLLIDGKLDENKKDQLDVVLTNFNLLNFRKIIPKKVIDLGGVVDGVVSIKKMAKSLMLTSDLDFNHFKINGNKIGKGNVKSTWNTDKNFLNIDGKFYKNHVPTILVNGNYFPFNKKETLDLTLDLNQINLSLLDNYIRNYVYNIQGRANANLHLTGTFKEPSLNGSINVLESSFKVIYLNTNYTTHNFRINVLPDMISFNNVEFFDKKKNSAKVNGTLLHQWFTKFNFDMGINLNNFLVLNTTEKDNKLYYGKAVASGFANITYDDAEKQTTIDVDIKTEKSSQFNIPLSNSDDIEANNFIEYVTRDTTKPKEEEKVDLSHLQMNFELHLNSNAEVRLIFDNQIGDVMRGVGDGDINLKIDNLGELSIYGNYLIHDGDYLFTLQNVINKRFDIEDGGTISWSGNPYDAQLDITATYRTRARLYDLLLGIDTSEIYKKRIPVDLKLRMRQAMLNPEITFDIDLPTADESTRSKVKSILYVTGNEENIQELNKQVFSLLVLNRFLPPPNVDAVGGNAGVGAATSSELLSNQLSNWLSRISDDFDIGVNYRPGDELSNQELELALSTQIFNDRLIIDSNFGLSDRKNLSSSSQNTSNLIGDVTLEYKISKDGKFRIKAFNVSNQFSLQNIDSPYTQGVGLFYKEEFNSFGEFFNNFFKLFKSKVN